MHAIRSSLSYGTRLLHQLALQGKQLFNLLDAEAIAQAEGIPHPQLKKILSNLAKQGRVLRLRRGLYASAGLLPGQIYTHPFVIATHLIQPSAISHWSALQHHGLTEQVPQRITASTPGKVVTPSMRKKKAHDKKAKHYWEIAGIQYEYITIQKKHFFGIEKIWLDEHSQVPITDRERTLIDVFIYARMFGGMGEALGILENTLPTIDNAKLINYAIRYDKKSLAKRLGWALEYMGVSKKILTPLLEVPIHYFCRLDPLGPARGTCDNRWMIQNNLTEE